MATYRDKKFIFFLSPDGEEMFLTTREPILIGRIMDHYSIPPISVGSSNSFEHNGNKLKLVAEQSLTKATRSKIEYTLNRAKGSYIDWKG